MTPTFLTLLGKLILRSVFGSNNSLQVLQVSDDDPSDEPPDNPISSEDNDATADDDKSVESSDDDNDDNNDDDDDDHYGDAISKEQIAAGNDDDDFAMANESQPLFSSMEPFRRAVCSTLCPPRTLPYSRNSLVLG